ncbi:MAG: hypothetical protein ACOX8E_05945 [Ruminococcus sp.]|jgi:hypothetical protein
MFFERNVPLFLAPQGISSWEQEQMQEREARLMKSFYPQTAARVQKLVEQECDRLEYDGSMMYDEYPDKFMMEHICRRIEEEVENSEIHAQERKGPEISDLIRVLFFNELYRRRCRRRRCRYY